MKASIDHLPADKQAQLAAMAAKIREMAPDVGMIVLFGSHARGDWVDDPEGGYHSDYDVLVVVESPEMAESHPRWSAVEREIRAFTGQSPVTLIVHDLRELNQQIRSAQFFFLEVWEQGVVLYDAKRFHLARPKATNAAERKALAQEYFDHWFASANSFFKNYKFSLGEHDNSIAAFLLHQAAERYFAALLLVFTMTKPKTHNLDELCQLAAPLHPLLAVPFPRETEEDRRLFKLLKSAYIDGRYKMSYRITAEELATLGERVKDLAGRIERACREKIESFG